MLNVSATLAHVTAEPQLLIYICRPLLGSGTGLRPIVNRGYNDVCYVVTI